MAEFQPNNNISELSKLYQFVKEYEPKFNRIYNQQIKNPLSNNFKTLFIELDNTQNVNSESKNLFTQAYQSLETAEYLLSRRKVVESMILMRSAYENIMMGFLINENPKIYEEFKILSFSESERNLTKVRSIRNKFNRKLKTIAPSFFEDMNREAIGKIADELYDKLCLYTHSSLVVSLFVELRKNNDDKLFIPFIELNLITIKLIMLYSMKYYLKSDLETIDFRYYLLNFGMKTIKGYKKKHTIQYLSQYNELLYPLINDTNFYSSKQGIDVQSFLNEFYELFKDKNVASFIVEVLQSEE